MKMQSREEVIAEMRATGKYAEPVAGQPTLGYLGDLGHVYARPDQLTKEALFSMDEQAPLVQSPQQAARAAAYERQMSMDSKLGAAMSSIGGLAARIKERFSPTDSGVKKSNRLGL